MLGITDINVTPAKITKMGWVNSSYIVDSPQPNALPSHPLTLPSPPTTGGEGRVRGRGCWKSERPGALAAFAADGRSLLESADQVAFANGRGHASLSSSVQQSLGAHLTHC